MKKVSRVLTKTAKRLLPSRSYSVLGTQRNLWTADNVVVSPFKHVEQPTTTIPEHVWTNLDRWADKTAVVCAVTNQQYTYHQLYIYSQNLAVSLRKKLGVVDGDVVCTMMSNTPDYSVAVLGILHAGAALTTINPVYTAHEIQNQLILSNPKVIITSTASIATIREGLKLLQKDIPIIVVKADQETLPSGTISFREFAEDNNSDHSILREVNIKPEDVALLPYSSGTTGMPKGVELTNKNVIMNFLQQDVDEVKHYRDTTKSYQDSVLAVLPFFHIYGLAVIMLHKLSVGLKLVSLPRFHPTTFVPAIKDHRVSLLYAAPPMILFLGSYADVKKEHVESIDRIVCGAAALPNSDVLKLLDKTKPNTSLTQLYGLTETSPLASCNVFSSKNYASAGYALSNTEIKIVDTDSNTLGPNEVGELWIRGPQVMKGYRNNPEATKNAITEDSWFRSGDLATIDKDGTITIAGRLKELIKVKGYQVPPAELESVLKDHPAVLDAGVVGIPDERTGEAPRAFVVLKEGKKVEADELKEFVKGRVAVYKMIKDVVFVDSLPKNPSGKLLRRILQEKYC